MDRARAARRWILVGGSVTATGLAVAAAAPVIGTGDVRNIHFQQTSGGLVMLLGWLVLGSGIHRLGRASAGARQRESGVKED